MAEAASGVNGADMSFHLVRFWMPLSEQASLATRRLRERPNYAFVLRANAQQSLLRAQCVSQPPWYYTLPSDGAAQ